MTTATREYDSSITERIDCEFSRIWNARTLIFETGEIESASFEISSTPASLERNPSIEEDLPHYSKSSRFGYGLFGLARFGNILWNGTWRGVLSDGAESIDSVDVDSYTKQWISKAVLGETDEIREYPELEIQKNLQKAIETLGEEVSNEFTIAKHLSKSYEATELVSAEFSLYNPFAGAISFDGLNFYTEDRLENYSYDIEIDTSDLVIGSLSARHSDTGHDYFRAEYNVWTTTPAYIAELVSRIGTFGLLRTMDKLITNAYIDSLKIKEEIDGVYYLTIGFKENNMGYNSITFNGHTFNVASDSFDESFELKVDEYGRWMIGADIRPANFYTNPRTCNFTVYTDDLLTIGEVESQLESHGDLTIGGVKLTSKDHTTTSPKYATFYISGYSKKKTKYGKYELKLSFKENISRVVSLVATPTHGTTRTPITLNIYSTFDENFDILQPQEILYSGSTVRAPVRSRSFSVTTFTGNETVAHNLEAMIDVNYAISLNGVNLLKQDASAAEFYVDSFVKTRLDTGKIEIKIGFKENMSRWKTLTFHSVVFPIFSEDFSKSIETRVEEVELYTGKHNHHFNDYQPQSFTISTSLTEAGMLSCERDVARYQGAITLDSTTVNRLDSVVAAVFYISSFRHKLQPNGNYTVELTFKEAI